MTKTSPHDIPRALRHLRRSAGLSRRDLCVLVSLDGGTLSPSYLAQCEAIPDEVSDPRSARRISEDKLAEILKALRVSRWRWDQLLIEKPWEGRPTPPASLLHDVEEGSEWEEPDRTLAEDVALLHQARKQADEEDRRALMALAKRILRSPSE